MYQFSMIYVVHASVAERIPDFFFMPRTSIRPWTTKAPSRGAKSHSHGVEEVRAHEQIRNRSEDWAAGK
jgi:hypothetical protein